MPNPYDTLPKVEILDEEGNVYQTWTSKDIPDGKTFEALIARILDYHPEVLGYIEFPAEYSKDLMADFEVTLDDQGVPDDPDRIGNFVIHTFTNGPVEMADAAPIRMHVQIMQNEGEPPYVRHTVFTSDRCYYKTPTSNGWIDAMADSKNKGRIYRGENDPTKNADGEQIEIDNLDTLAWLDTGNEESPVLKLPYKTEEGLIIWTEIWAPNAMDAEIYDPQHKCVNVYQYLNDLLQELTGDYGLFLKHKANELVLIHVTLAERTRWDAALTLDELLALLNAFLEDMRQGIKDLYDSETGFSELGEEYDALRAKYFAHIDPEGDPPHVTEEDAKNWDQKASGDHTHYIDGRVGIRAEDIVSGNIKPSNIPDSVKERVIELDTIERLADPIITDEDRKGKYHTGNVIAVDDTSVDPAVTHWYKITDPSKLGTADYMDGVLPFDPAPIEANEASFKYITDHPTTLDGYEIHDEVYTKEEFDALLKEYERLLGNLSKTMQILLKYNPLPIPLDMNGNSRVKIGVQIGGKLEGTEHDMVLHALGTETDEELDLTQYRNISSAYDANKNHSWGILWDYVPNEKIFENGDEPQKTVTSNFKVNATIQTNLAWAPIMMIGEYTNNGGTNHDGTVVPGNHKDVGIWIPNQSGDPTPQMLTCAASMCGFYDEDYEYVDCAVIDETYNGTIGQKHRSCAIIVKGTNGYRILHIICTNDGEPRFDTQLIRLGGFLTDIQGIIGAPTLSADGNAIYQEYVIFGTFLDGTALGMYRIPIENTDTPPVIEEIDIRNTFTMGSVRFHDPIVTTQNLNELSNRKYRVLFDDIEGDSTRIMEITFEVGTSNFSAIEVAIPEDIIERYPDTIPMGSAILNGSGEVLLACHDHERKKAAVYALHPNNAHTIIYEPGHDLVFNFGDPIITDINLPRKPYINTRRTANTFVDTLVAVSMELTAPPLDEESDATITSITVMTYARDYVLGIWESFALEPHNGIDTTFDYYAWTEEDPTSTRCIMITTTDELNGEYHLNVLHRKTDPSKDVGILRWVISPQDFFYADIRLKRGYNQEILLQGIYDEETDSWNSAVCSTKLFQLQAIINGLKEWELDKLDERREVALRWMAQLTTAGTDIGNLGEGDEPYDPENPDKPDKPPVNPDNPTIPDEGLAELIARHYWSKEVLQAMLDSELNDIMGKK